MTTTRKRCASLCAGRIGEFALVRSLSRFAPNDGQNIYNKTVLRPFFACLLLFLLAFPLRAQTLARELAGANHAWKTDDYPAAEIHFDRALQLAGDDRGARIEAFYGRGAVKLEQEKWASAREDLTRCLELDPRDADAYMARGMARKALGDYDGLLEDAHQAARLDPEWKGFEADAKSTVLYRRAMLGFLILGGVVVCLGAIPLVKSLVRVSQLERAGRGAK